MSLDLGTVSVKVGADLNDLKRGLGEARGQFANLGAAAKAANIGAPLEQAAEAARELGGAAKEVAKDLEKKPTGLFQSMKQIGDEAHHTGRALRRAFAVNVLIADSQRLVTGLKGVGGAMTQVGANIVDVGGRVGQAFVHGGPLGAAIASLMAAGEAAIEAFKGVEEAAKQAGEAAAEGHKSAAEAVQKYREQIEETTKQLESMKLAEEKGSVSAGFQRAQMDANDIQRQADTAAASVARWDKVISQLTAELKAIPDADVGDFQERRGTKSAELANAQRMRAGAAEVRDTADAGASAKFSAQLQALKVAEIAEAGRLLALHMEKAQEAAMRFGSEAGIGKLSSVYKELAKAKLPADQARDFKEKLDKVSRSLVDARDAANFAGEAIFKKAQKEHYFEDLARAEAADRATYGVADRRADVAGKSARDYARNSEGSRSRAGNTADEDAADAAREFAENLKKVNSQIAMSGAFVASMDAQKALAAGDSSKIMAERESFKKDNPTSPVAAAMSAEDNPLGSAVGALVDSLKDAGGALKGAISSIAGVVADILPSIGDVMHHTVAGRKALGIVANLQASLMPAMEKVLGPLLPALWAFAQMIGHVVGAIGNFVGKYAEPIAKILYKVVSGIGSVWNGIVDVIAWILRGIANVLNFVKKGLGDAAQALADGVKSAEVTVPTYKSATDAVTKMAVAADAATAALTNVPSGYKVALATFNAMDGQSGPSAGSATGQGAQGGNVESGRKGRHRHNSASVQNNFTGDIHVHGGDPNSIVEKFESFSTKRMRQLGTIVAAGPLYAGN